ncbi:MAG TPA: molybdopterin-dependent oxidoreductase [Candidatus Tectomicrobia bacterium]|nr:molybdopterin-dependent oxidoreductase [Candidatus Tectomicrobia bacterium]
MSDRERSVVRTTCTRDCPDTCAVVARVENGRVVQLAGDPGHPLTHGFLCKKTYQYPSRVYSSSRILHPLKRTEAGWRRITWDEAFDTLAEWLTTVKAQDGSLGVLHYQSAGSMGLLKVLNNRFFNLWGGVTEAVGSLCAGAGIAGQLKSYGSVRSHAPQDLLNSRTIMIWGRNPLVTNIHMLPLLKAAKERGATVIVIDPRRSETVRYADQHVALKPGGDRYLAIGLAQSLLRQGLVDWEFLCSATANFAEFERLLASVDEETILDQTGLSAETLEALAHLYGTRKPGSIHLGMGPQRWMVGAEVFQVIDALAALTGNIGVPGGGVNYASRLPALIDLSWVADNRAKSRRLVLRPSIGRDVLATHDPAVRLAWVCGANPVTQALNSNLVRQALAQLDHLVVSDIYLTDTAQYAHLFLPTTTFVEEEDLVVTDWWHSYFGYVRPVIPPRGEAKSDLAIFQGLAARLGFGADMAGSAGEWLGRLIAPMQGYGITLDRLRAEGWARHPLAQDVPFADRKFYTRSQKFEFLTAWGEDFRPAVDYPLYLITGKTNTRLNSQVLDRDRDTLPQAWVHPQVLVEAGLSAGEEATVESAFGCMRVRVHADGQQRHDTLFTEQGTWLSAGGTPNQLTGNVISHHGQLGAFNHVSVRLAPPRQDL